MSKHIELVMRDGKNSLFSFHLIKPSMTLIERKTMMNQLLMILNYLLNELTILDT